MSAKDDLIADLRRDFAGLNRPQFEQVITVLDRSSSADQALSLATALEEFVPGVADRIKSYTSADDVTEYVRILRGSVINVMTRWNAGEDPPDVDTVAKTIETIE